MGQQPEKPAIEFASFMAERLGCRMTQLADMNAGRTKCWHLYSPKRVPQEYLQEIIEEFFVELAFTSRGNYQLKRLDYDAQEHTFEGTVLSESGIHGVFMVSGPNRYGIKVLFTAPVPDRSL